MKVLCTIERETPKAYLIKVGEAKHWLPRSQVKRDNPASNGLEEIEVADWLAAKSGLA